MLKIIWRKYVVWAHQHGFTQQTYTGIRHVRQPVQLSQSYHFLPCIFQAVFFFFNQLYFARFQLLLTGMCILDCFKVFSYIFFKLRDVNLSSILNISFSVLVVTVEMFFCTFDRASFILLQPQFTVITLVFCFTHNQSAEKENSWIDKREFWDKKHNYYDQHYISCSDSPPNLKNRSITLKLSLLLPLSGVFLYLTMKSVTNGVMCGYL